ncbi:hypothetical protein Tco_0603144 [Tanacetum coccineum]
MHEKTKSPRSCLRWQPTGKFKTVGLRWVPTGKIFASITTKVDSEPTNSLNEDITNPYECKQTLNVSGFKEFKSNEQAMTSDHNSLELGIHYHSNELSRSKLVPKVVSPADKKATSQQEFFMTNFNHKMNENKGIMPTKIELTLEQSQQGVSNDVLVSIEGVEELKRDVWIKCENKAALSTLYVETESIHNLSVFTKMNSDIEDDIMDPVMQCTTLPSHSSFSQQKLVLFVTEIHTLSIDISLRDC